MSLEDLVIATEAFVKAGNALGSHAATSSAHFSKAIAAHNDFIGAASRTAKADPATLTSMYSGVQLQLDGVEAVSTAAGRGPLALHVKCLADALPLFYWVSLDAKPVPYIEEYISVVTVTVNKILVATKGTPEAPLHHAFVTSLQGAARALQAFVKAEHTTGLRWNCAGSSKAAGPPASSGSDDAPTFGTLQKSAAALVAGLLAAEGAAPEVAKIAGFAQSAFDHHFSVLNVAATTAAAGVDKKSLFAPLEASLCAIGDAVGAHSRSKHFLLLEATQQIAALLSWVAIENNKPVGYLKENAEILEFSLNKIMRSGGAVKEWAVQARKLSNELVAYVTEFHKTGLYFSGGAGKGGQAAHADPAAADDDNRCDAAFLLIPRLAEAVDPALADACSKLLALATAAHNFIQAAKASPKPVDVTKSPVLVPVTELLVAVTAVCESNLRHKTLSVHYETVGQAANLFNWLVLDKPMSFLEDNMGSLDFFVNKILSASKGKDGPTAWIKAVKVAAASVLADVKSNYRTGVTWGASAPKATAGPPMVKTGGPPPPPPPKPPAGPPKPTQASTGGGNDMSQLFSQISSQGLDITKTLRHVSDSEKLYKQTNREVRTVNDAELQKNKKKSVHQWAPPKGTARMECQGEKKWMIEYFDGGDASAPLSVEIANPQRNQIVIINRCNNALIKVPAKVNSIQILESARIQLDVTDTVGPIEVTGSESVEILIHGVVPNVITGKVKGITVHLCGGKETEIVTSCTVNANVTYGIVDADGDNDTVEVAIPEQFTCTVVKNKVVTAAVEHSSA